MKFEKNAKSIVVIYAIVAVVFILLSVAVPFLKPAASWVMFAFSIVSIAGGCGVSLYALSKPEELKSKYYGYPVFRIGFLYTVVQLCLTVLVYIIGAFVNLPYWVGLILSVLLLGAAAIGVIAADNVKDYVEKIEENTVISTRTIKRFNIDIAGILDICENQDVYLPLKKLAEKFKYSDTVSCEATEETEIQIKTEVDNLKNIINVENTEVVLGKIKTISDLLSARNRICEASKRM